MSRNERCFCDANISGQLIQLHGWERICFTVNPFLGVGVGGWVCTRRVGLHVTAKKIKICSHLHVDKTLIHRMFPKGWSNSNCLYSRMNLIWYAQDWRGAGLSIFIKLT